MVLKGLLWNEVFLAILIAGLLAQLIKVFIFWTKHGEISWKDLFVTGGMPSFHAAFVLSLVTIFYLTEGITNYFLISLVLAVIVVVDALGVRRTAGEEGKLLSKIVKKMHVKTKFHYSVGHTPLQVFVGGVLGIVVALAVYYV